MRVSWIIDQWRQETAQFLFWKPMQYRNFDHYMAALTFTYEMNVADGWAEIENVLYQLKLTNSQEDHQTTYYL